MLLALFLMIAAFLCPFAALGQVIEPVPQDRYLWATFDLVPGSDTFFLDINDAGDIVGQVQGPDNVPHAFLLSQLTLLPLVCPDQDATHVSAVNSRRQVGGTCAPPLGSPFGRKGFVTTPVRERRSPMYGFLGSADDIADPFVDIDVRGMNDWGHTVGAWSSHRGGIFEGFWSTGAGGVFWRLKAVVPERPVFNTWFNGINNAHNVVGAYAERPSFPPHGLFYNQGVFLTFDVPGTRSTSWWDLNDHLQIVGSAEDADGPFSVLYEHTPPQFRRLDYPDPAVLFTDAVGINNAGVIVGVVLLPHPDEPGGVVFKGFVAAPKPAGFGTGPAALALTSRATPAAGTPHIAPQARVQLNWETCTTTADRVIPTKMRSMLGCE